MVEKKSIVRELGEEGLLLPELVNSALTANDRIKYYFTLLQTAREKAEHPQLEFPSLRIERENAGEENAKFDRIVSGALKKGHDIYIVPFAEEILSRVWGCMNEMLKPLLATGRAEGKEFEARLEELKRSGAEIEAGLSASEPGILRGDFIRALTSGNRGKSDSLHILVMDVHKALNRIQEELAVENLEGAKVYLVAEEDRKLIISFMSGVNRTFSLKFEHPGLGTTATRIAGKLVIQNDIGETEAHVLVVNVRGLEASVTYTDIHLQRLLFFQSLFEETGTSWEDTVSRASGEKFEDKLYHLSVGRFLAKGREELKNFLALLGSRIVFLIDWNRARKSLRNFMRNADCVKVLRWAAENECGHRAFLILGGEQLIFGALELASRAPLPYGEPLYQIIGRERTTEYFQWVLQRASKGLLAGDPLLLIQDEIRAELLRYFHSAEQDLMEICSEHASLIVETAGAVRGSLLYIAYKGEPNFVLRNSKRAKVWESQADEFVNRIRTISKRIENADFFEKLIFHMDDVIDALEDAVFFATLIPPVDISRRILESLEKMAGIVLESSREFLKTVYAYQCSTRICTPDEMQAFFGSTAQVISLERTCDEAFRKANRVIVEVSTDFKEAMLARDIATKIEEASNSLMLAAFTIRERAFEVHVWEGH
ncbi:hypothetical protein BGV40_07385 [Methanosarcina sp. Ant1]|nr:hypothetical protein BGV40_07385 [Methanosarcina sp. Ant1]